MSMRSIRQEKEKVVQKKLRNMGVCVQGYQWIRQAGGTGVRGVRTISAMIG